MRKGTSVKNSREMVAERWLSRQVVSVLLSMSHTIFDVAQHSPGMRS